MDHYAMSLIKACINVTNAVLIHSGTRDLRIRASRAATREHDFMIETTREMAGASIISAGDDYKKLANAIKSSVGNCGEFSLLCGALLIILARSDRQFASYNMHFYEGSLYPCDHSFIVAKIGSFFKKKVGYVIDPWSVLLPINHSLRFEHIILPEAEFLEHTKNHPRDFGCPINQGQRVGILFTDEPFEIEILRNFTTRFSSDLYKQIIDLFHYYRIVQMLEQEIQRLLPDGSYRLEVRR